MTNQLTKVSVQDKVRATLVQAGIPESGVKFFHKRDSLKPGQDQLVLELSIPVDESDEIVSQLAHFLDLGLIFKSISVKPK